MTTTRPEAEPAADLPADLAADLAADPARAYARAMGLQRAGRFDEALAIYQRLLAAGPSAEVHFQAARIYIDVGRYPAAIAQARAAVEARPAEPAVWQIWAEAVALDASPVTEAELLAGLRRAPLPPAARVALQDRFAGKRPAPKLPPPLRARMNRLMEALAAGRPAEAEAGALALLKQDPKLAPAANLLAAARGAMGARDAAIQAFAQAAKLDATDPQPFDNMALLLTQAGRDDEAQAMLRRAVVAGPAYVPALVRLAGLLNRHGRHEAALPYAAKAAKLEPRNALAQMVLGAVQTRLRDFAAAEAAFGRAMKLDPKRPGPIEQRAQALARLDRDAEALDLYDRALALDPDHAASVAGKASVLQTLGRFDEAQALFRRAIDLDPRNGEILRGYLASHKVTAGDPLLDRMIATFEDPALPEAQRSSFGFSIVKALEDMKAYDRVFPYLRAANDIAHAADPYDMDLRRREVAAVKQSLAGHDWTRGVGGTDAFAPIFVTGMPRSGTTLVEQIIASHSRVTGAGEANVAASMATRLVFDRDGVRALGSVPDAEIAAFGRDYADEMRRRFPGALQVTDKSIQTYMYLGLMKLALPNARFVVVRRDPRDNLLSIYRNKFLDGTHGYSTSLRDLGEYYRTFVEMIEFWRAEMPGGFHEIQYETLVADPEAETRALIAACGLEWEDACLSFHQTSRKIDTLSVFQARQPISTASLAAWRRYEPHLGELFEALGDLCPKD
ncbi:tetratricopeptide repeat-containing sulfotransferase family protein [Frigidibacter sp. MR17.24]|uniref:tetratricopeptide repeat-containing sulfotransferase family protein n=1 Tax=Frigidibacter sp. MR17.24 TaxID=3127345 RepID=UPI0030129FE8